MSKYSRTNTVEVGEEVPVIFNGMFFRSGTNRENNSWTLLDVRFEGTNNTILSDPLWNIHYMSPNERMSVNTKLSQLGEAVSRGQDIWNDPNLNPKQRSSAVKCFSNIVNSFNRFVGAEIFVKTLVKGVDDDETDSMLPSGNLVLLDNNVIIHYKKGILKYNTLERNNVESYDIEIEDSKSKSKSKAPIISSNF